VVELYCFTYTEGWNILSEKSLFNYMYLNPVSPLINRAGPLTGGYNWQNQSAEDFATNPS